MRLVSPMIDSLAKNLIILKKEFIRVYDGSSQIQEIIPKSKSKLFPIEQSHLELLHQFASKNPIYYNSFEKQIGSVECIVYEGDINRYWLNSIGQSASKAPFSPTWIMSGYIGSLFAKVLGYSEVIDIGSGDGRIAFCAKVLGLESYSIELDGMLADLQNTLSTILDFHPICFDATSFDYRTLHLRHPIFFIGGLAQMGGVLLASSVLDSVALIPNLAHNAGWAFAGTISQKYAHDPKNMAGWGTVIEDYNLKCIKNISLPTAWSFHEPDETIYIFAEST